MGRRITRKQLKQDEFVTTVDSIIQKASDNWRPIVAGVGGLIVVILGWWLISGWMGNRAEDASYLLRDAIASYEGTMEQGGDTPTSDTASAETQFQEVIDRYGRTDQADVARLYLARIWMGRGDVEQARESLLSLANAHRRDALGELATLNLITLRVLSGQGEQVASELQAMVAGVDQSLPKDVALFELGNLYEQEQQTEKARESFQRLVDEFPESPYRFPATERLRELS
ncbi:MAG: tetratricopeptide repeat protein [bacterium]|nr:tetratricopeptide repeat protein [bacterium]